MGALTQHLSGDVAGLVRQVGSSLVSIQSTPGGVGSGVILHPEGLVVTNAHVVRAPSLRVAMPGGGTSPARVLALDQEYDLAAIVVKARGLPAIDLGESGDLRPGQWVAALGHPFGITGAATTGVVIGVGSDLPELGRSGREWVAVGLRLRPGNSGGPLVDAAGRLVGINTMMTGSSVGMAVPTSALKRFLRQYLGSRQTAAV